MLCNSFFFFFVDIISYSPRLYAIIIMDQWWVLLVVVANIKKKLSYLHDVYPPYPVRVGYRRLRRVRTTCAPRRRRRRPMNIIACIYIHAYCNSGRLSTGARSFGLWPMATPIDGSGDGARVSSQCRHRFVFRIGIIHGGNPSDLSVLRVSGRRRRRHRSLYFFAYIHNIVSPLHTHTNSPAAYIARVRFIIIITIYTHI